MTAAATIDEYLASLSPPVRAAMQTVRARVAASAPEATESINYDMPSFRYRGTWLVGFGAFKRHCSFFPGTIRFTPDEPLGPGVVEDIVRERMAAIDAKRRAR